MHVVGQRGHVRIRLCALKHSFLSASISISGFAQHTVTRFPAAPRFDRPGFHLQTITASARWAGTMGLRTSNWHASGGFPGSQTANHEQRSRGTVRTVHVVFAAPIAQHYRQLWILISDALARLHCTFTNTWRHAPYFFKASCPALALQQQEVGNYSATTDWKPL